jgi:ankyrin repeat protein
MRKIANEIKMKPLSLLGRGWSCFFATSRCAHAARASSERAHGALRSRHPRAAHQTNRIADKTAYARVRTSGTGCRAWRCMTNRSHRRPRCPMHAILALLLTALPAACPTPLHQAAETGDVGAVEHAMDTLGYTDLSAADNDHYTPLHLAAGMGHESVVRLLLERGAPIDATDENGEQPLHLASHLGHTAIVEGLLGAGADVNAASHSGYAPLHMAAEQGQVQALKALLAAGADVAAVTDQGTTPLHWAAFHDRVEVAASLLRHGASTAAQDADGDTPVALALKRSKEGQSSDVLELLKGLARHSKEQAAAAAAAPEQRQHHDEV